MPRAPLVALVLSVLAASSSALAAPVSRTVPAGGGQDAVTVTVDVDSGELTVVVGGATSRIATKIAPDARNVKIEALDLAGGKHAVWAHVPSRTDATSYDLVQAGSTVLFQGPTGFTSGQPGSMTGETVEMATASGKPTLVHAKISESVVLCGRGRTFLSTEVLDPNKGAFVAGAADVFTAQELKAATPIVLSSHSGTTAPLVPLLVAAGTTTGEDGRALVDGEDLTPWASGARGDAALFRAPTEVPIGRLSISITKPVGAANPHVVAPRTLVLTTGRATFLLTFPEDAMLKGGGTYDVTFTEPIKASCLGVVLDQAYDHGQVGAKVTLGEIRARSALELGGATLATLPPLLSPAGPTSDAALAILKRAGDRALVPLKDAWPKLDEYGRELAIDAAAAAPCGTSTPLLLDAICTNGEVARKAESALLRCHRSSNIVAAVGTSGTFACPRIPSLLALLGKEAALPALGRALGKGDVDTRSSIRQAFATAARDVPGDKIAPLLADPAVDVAARLELLRALGPRVVDVGSAAAPVLDELLGPAAPMDRRWLALGPLAELARGGNTKEGERLGGLLAKDPDWQVRARAAELANGIPAAQAALLGAIDDPQPRVREAALRTVASQKISAAGLAAQKKLDADPWTFVRLAAAQAIGAMPAAPDLDAGLATALEKEKSSPVEEAILLAIAAHHAKDALPSVRGRFTDDREDAEVRAAAARTLGALCDASSTDELVEVALHADDPLISSEGLGLTLAAIEALGAIHPKDLGSKLSSLLAADVKEGVRNATRRAVGGSGTCGGKN